MGWFNFQDRSGEFSVKIYLTQAIIILGKNYNKTQNN